MVETLLCFVFVSKKLDPLSRYLKMSWRGKPSQRLPPWTPPALAPTCLLTVTATAAAAACCQAVTQSGRQTGVGRLRDTAEPHPPDETYQTDLSSPTYVPCRLSACATKLQQTAASNWQCLTLRWDNCTFHRYYDAVHHLFRLGPRILGWKSMCWLAGWLPGSSRDIIMNYCNPLLLLFLCMFAVILT